MMKEEFMELANVKDISNDDYALIEYIYTWHPLIKDTTGKMQVAGLYENFGIAIFKEMLPKAQTAEKLESDLCEAMNKVDEIKRNLAELKK